MYALAEADYVNNRWVDRIHLEKVVLAKKVGQFLSADKTDQERAVVENIARLLTKDISGVVRQSLAFELRNCHEMPKDVANRIAKDVEDVASPFLSDTDIFSDHEMADLARAVDEFARIAIARRPHVPGEVSIAIAEMGGEKAVTYLIRNPGAEMPKKACDQVMRRFENTLAVLDLLASRIDLPVSVAEKLINKVSEDCRKTLTKHYRVNGGKARELSDSARISSLFATIEKASQRQIDDYVFELMRRDELTDQLILQMTAKGSLKFFESAMAIKLGLPVTNVRALLRDGSQIGLSRLLEKAHIRTDLLPVFRKTVSAAVKTGKAAEKETVPA